MMGCTVERGGLRIGGEPKIGGNQNDGGVVGWGTQFWGALWKMGDPKWRGGDDQKLGGTKMMGVQLDGGLNDGLHRGTWGNQNRGGTKNWRETK